MFRRFGLIAPLCSLLVLTQCGAPTPPQCKRVPLTSRQPGPELIDAARRAWQTLENPALSAQWPAARERYNTAVGHLFDQLRCGPKPWDQAAAALGTRILPPGADDIRLADLDTMFPATEVNTRQLGPRQTTAGLGLPAVGWKPQSSIGRRRDPFATPTGQPFTVTALLRFDRGPQPAWQFAAPLQQDDTPLAGRRVKLAADWSAAHAFYWHMSDLDDFDALKVILPDRFSEETGLYFGQPYDPGRIPVVFIHGINSSPATFKRMINHLAGQEWFRKKYQVWFFNYPTGNPWILTSARFRENMRAATAYARKHGDKGKLGHTVIVAHSMGGLVTRSSLSEPGTAFYDAFFKKPIDQLDATEEGRRKLRESLLYHPLETPDRVIFLAVPHQGSPMAERFVFTWLSRLVRLPKTFTVELFDLAMRNAGSLMLPDSGRLPTAIDNLSPNDATVRALQRTHLRPGLHLHSIIGDRGHLDTPHSSDGIVPYWSSHFEPVESEKIVPCGHDVPSDPQAAEEVGRILRLNGRPD